MAAKITFFPVGNGDMTLIQLESGRNILIDINIRSAADDVEEETPDVAEELKKRLHRDNFNWQFVDVFLLSHPDKDHCTGLQKHFHLGPLDDWSDEEDKIIIREMWSSPIVFRRASRTHTLCDDAKAFNTEARRRVNIFRKNGKASDGDRILILGEDENGKTDDLRSILIKVDEEFNKINGQIDQTIIARLLAPLPIAINEEEEESLSKNRSSTIIRFSMACGDNDEACLFLTGGDAEVAIWERIWERNNKNSDNLNYHILLSPHHCSWHSLSYDSWSEKGNNAKVCEKAKNSLSFGKTGGIIVSSSKPIKDDNNDPPCFRAKREYLDMAKDFSGRFICIGDNNTTLDFEISRNGPIMGSSLGKQVTVVSSGIIGRQPLQHG